MKIFEHDTYQNVIKAYVDSQKALGLSVTYQRLAKEMRVQKSYLSKVMSGNASLNKDQAFLLSKFMRLKNEEEEYLFLLVEKDRAALKEYRRKIDSKLKQIQLKQTQSSAYLDKVEQDASSAAAQVYYLYPEIQLIHLAFGLERYREKPNILKDDLGVQDLFFQKAIKTLQELSLIALKGNSVELLKSNLHLSRESDLFHQWKTQFKLKSIEWTKRLAEGDKYNFVASFTASEEDKEKIRLEFMRFLKKTESVVKNSNGENLYQINFDLFKWL